MSYVIAENLTKSFAATPVFSGLNFSVSKGEFITLLGPSGCGKSTLLRCLAGLEPVNDGRIYVNKQNITSSPPQQREIGMVFQSYALFPNMTVRQNILCGMRRIRDKSEKEEKLKKMLAEELKQRAHKLEKIKKDAEALAAKLEGVSLTIATKVSSTGTIFGSVGNIQIAEELAKLGHEIDRKIIVVKDAVKEVGAYKAIVKLHKEVSVEIPFEVVAE